METKILIILFVSTGNLHFAYTILSDALSADMVYKCVVTNPYLDIKSGGSYTAVSVQRSKFKFIKPVCILCKWYNGVHTCNTELVCRSPYV